MAVFENPVLTACRDIFGLTAPYPWQRLLIAGVLEAADPPCGRVEPLRRIAVLPTGAGKSLCWMLPAVLIRGLTVAVFPLLSLMSDQARRLDAAGIPYVRLQGGQTRAERRAVWKRLEDGRVRILLTNPEMLRMDSVVRRLGALEPRFLVVDETHTVSQWGESFRPACAELGRVVAEWNPPAVLALTATAGPRIRRRIRTLLFNGEALTEALADPDRPAVRYGVLPALSRFHALERLVRSERRPLVVFGVTRPSVERAARLLRHRLNDPRIRYYHAGLEPGEKRRLEEWFLRSCDGVLCATCAYGMGVDKSNIRTVIHMAPPSSVEAYLQESGRAARDGAGANAWLIWTPEDATGRRNDEPPPADSGRPVGNPMMAYAASTDRCRREMLLGALGIEAQDCSGCDVCSGEAWSEALESSIILGVVRRNRRRFRRGQLARVLIGRRTAEIRRMGLDSVRGFGALAGWELEDAEEAIGCLLATGGIHFAGAARRKRLTVGKTTQGTRRNWITRQKATP